jgi:phosphatidylinositol alpha-mannosyltransferase
VRIAIVHHFTWADARRGGERYAHDLAWWLAGQGHEVDFIAGGPAHSISESEGARLVRLHHRHGERLTKWGQGKAETFGVTVIPWLARHRYDVVHALSPATAVASRMTGQRTVFTAIGHPSAADGSRSSKLIALASRAAQVTTALSAASAKALSDLTGRPAIVVNPGVRLEQFTPNLAPRTGPPRLLFAAYAGEPRKRLPDLLAAMPRVLEALPETRLVLGGGGGLPSDVPNDVRAAIDEIGTGNLSDVPQRYRDASVTVLPSADEAFGLVLVESLACGTPVVAARSGGMPEIVGTDAGVGGLADIGDVDALADAVIATARLASDPETAPRCVIRAQQWGWDKVGPDHIAAYQAARRRPR